MRPYGHGPFLPCLVEAEYLLTRNSCASCAVGLIFLSDGAPSDAAIDRNLTKEECQLQIAAKIEQLSMKFGRRLSFTAIAIGDQEHFETLERMVDSAKDYEAKSELKLPSMTSSSLGDVFTSVATSITTTQTEMTDIATMKQRKVRDVTRESRKKANEQISVVSPLDFFIYPASLVKRTIYKEWFEERVKKTCFEETPLQHSAAKFVAISKGPFGEGAERFAYRFFELAKDRRTILGPPLVAKESRLVLEDESGDQMARKKFVRTFCATQQLARRLAEEFNEKLDQTHRVHAMTPRVTFLDCSIYQLNDKHLGKQSVLVERKLDHTKWHKWNSNNGYVEGMHEASRYAHENHFNAVPNAASIDLAMVEEGSEEEESDAEENP